MTTYKDQCLQVERLRALGENWDSYGAAAISPKAVDRALQFLWRCEALGFPVPSAAPVNNGNVAFFWGDEELSIELGPAPDRDNGKVDCSWMGEIVTE